ncbi:MAG: UPF0175 family protein [Candidatus Nanohaloarchaea archaeon]
MTDSTTDTIADAAARTGEFRDREEFLSEAVDTYLAARKDTRIDIAAELYEEGKVSVGRACEIADIGREAFKRELRGRGIELRRGAVSSETVKNEAEELLRRSG